MNEHILNLNEHQIILEQELINIKIRTLDNEFLVDAKLDNKVEDLKRRIENVYNTNY